MRQVDERMRGAIIDYANATLDGLLSVLAGNLNDCGLVGKELSDVERAIGYVRHIIDESTVYLVNETKKAPPVKDAAFQRFLQRATGA